MKKIPTLFERDWDGDRKVINKFSKDVDMEALRNSVATEKVDGTNIRVTVRSGCAVRVEKRRNPSKLQKAAGITAPWYIDADRSEPSDKWVFDAVKNTNWLVVPRGEWSGEAYGPKIQGNPLGAPGHCVYLFSCRPVVFSHAPEFSGEPNLSEIQEFVCNTTSLMPFAEGAPIEGVVWWSPDMSFPVAKIKRKDFR